MQFEERIKNEEADYARKEWVGHEHTVHALKKAKGVKDGAYNAFLSAAAKSTDPAVRAAFTYFRCTEGTVNMLTTGEVVPNV